jgi:glycosyltransferase involved in cell wall biosynthesis
MKIVVVGPTYPFREGIAHYTTLLTSHLAAEHDTRLYSFERQYPAWLFPGRSQIDPSGKPLAEVEARRWLTPWWPLSWRRVTEDWKAWQPDRVVVQWWVPFMVQMTAWLIDHARRWHMRSLMICHNVLPHERSQIDQMLARLALDHADQLIVHSTAQQALAQELLPGHSTTVIAHPTYADFRTNTWTRDAARTQLKIDDQVLLFFGLIRPYKGLLDLIEALPAIVNEVNVKLLVVGEIWGDVAPYHDRVQVLGLAEQVQFIDRYVSNDETAMYFAGADLTVLPYREATGSDVLQMARGLDVPVVATRTGGMDGAVQDGVTGFLADACGVTGLSHAITRFFREDRSSEFRRNIQAGQAAFDWERLVQEIVTPVQGPPA